MDNCPFYSSRLLGIYQGTWMELQNVSWTVHCFQRLLLSERALRWIIIVIILHFLYVMIFMLESKHFSGLSCSFEGLRGPDLGRRPTSIRQRSRQPLLLVEDYALVSMTLFDRWPVHLQNRTFDFCMFIKMYETHWGREWDDPCASLSMGSDFHLIFCRLCWHWIAMESRIFEELVMATEDFLRKTFTTFLYAPILYQDSEPFWQLNMQ